MEYFHNEGMTKTIINGKEIEEADWNANYNGKNGNIKLNILDNGKRKHVEMKIKDKKDLAKIMNFQPAIDTELENNIITNYQPNLFSNFSKTNGKSKKERSRKKGGRRKKSRRRKR